MDAALLDCDGLDFKHSYGDGIFRFLITAHAGGDFCPPGFDETNGLAKKIRGIVGAHGAQD